MILKKGLKLIGLGIGVGTLASLALTRLMTSMLFGTRANDPATFFLVALLARIRGTRRRLARSAPRQQNRTNGSFALRLAHACKGD